MITATHLVNYVNLVAFVALALVALQEWRSRRHRAAAWVALTFLSLALVVVLGRYTGDHPRGLLEHFVSRVEIACLVVFPYLLYRFTTSFREAGRRLSLLVAAMTSVLLVYTFSMPYLPQAGQRWPAWFMAYVALFVIHWVILAISSASRLWSAGQGQPAVARKRMQMLAGAATALTIALLLVVASPGPGSGVSLASGLLGTLSAVSFLLGLSPPSLVRSYWRRPATARMQEAIGSIMGLAQDQEEIAERVLEPIAAIVGARAVAVQNADDKVVASHDVGEETVRKLEAHEPLEHPDCHRVDFAGGSIVVWTSPYAPFFGDEELRILRSLGSLTGLALDRARLFAQEHQARLALEQADELKSNFIALASHELRTPVAAINGFIQTLVGRRDSIDEGQRRLIEDTLEEQGSRMARLVEQLLDLSRLDAAAIDIHPQALPIREKISEVVETAAAGHEDDVKVDVPEGLEVEVDAHAFERILTNLVTNAFRYGSPPVVISAQQSDNHFRLRVEDHGRGVPEEFVPELFERFTRSNGSQAAAKGTGLGLAIARSYAQAHQGDLYYEGAEAEGACFQLVLPRHPKGSRNGAPA